MRTFDEVAEMLDEISEEIPEAFYEGLNGGVYLRPDVKISQESRNEAPLYILGEYISRYDLGKYINIYYGSLMRVYSGLSDEKLRKELKRVLTHEFTHHVEYLAGVKNLERKDEMEMDKYRRKGNVYRIKKK